MRKIKRTLALLLTAAVVGLPTLPAKAAETPPADLPQSTSLKEEIRALEDSYETSDLTYDEKKHTVSLHVEKPAKAGLLFYCDATYDMNKQIFSHTVTMMNKWGLTMLKWKKVVPAKWTSAGNLETSLSLDDAPAQTDLKNTYQLLADKATMIQSNENYKHNKALEESGEGVDFGCYVFDQTNTWTKGHKCGDYQVGLGHAKFAKVGCEIASCYNVAITLGKPERLSETIRYAEQHMLINIGFGHLGSNPKKLDRYMNYKGFHYEKITNFRKFKEAVDKYDNCRIIMSRWNSSIFHGLHTYYIDKTAPGQFHGYNVNYGYDTPEPAETSLDPYNNSGPFIVGYIVW
jgi:hypothetical protein